MYSVSCDLSATPAPRQNAGPGTGLTLTEREPVNTGLKKYMCYLLKTFTKNLTKEGYEIIIDEHLAPFMSSYPYKPCYLIQDNDPKHGSELCANALAKNNIPWVNKKVYYLISKFSVFSINLY
jgi:hypothetical protein